MEQLNKKVDYDYIKVIHNLHCYLYILLYQTCVIRVGVMSTASASSTSRFHTSRFNTDEELLRLNKHESQSTY